MLRLDKPERSHSHQHALFIILCMFHFNAHVHTNVCVQPHAEHVRLIKTGGGLNKPGRRRRAIEMVQPNGERAFVCRCAGSLCGILGREIEKIYC